MTPYYRELDLVWIRTLDEPTRHVSGTDGVVRQPRVGDQGTIVHFEKPDHCTVECVDSSGRTVWLAEFRFDELSPPLTTWTFETREVSASVYRVTGNGPRGMRVESTHDDVERALGDCRAFALRYPE